MVIVRNTVLLLAVLLIHACGSDKSSDDFSSTTAPPGTTMRAALVTSNADIASVLVEVSSEGALVDSQTISIGPLPLPGRTVMGGDAFFTVAPGKYSVQAVAIDASGEVIADCARASTSAEVVDGQTTEVTLTIVCGGGGNGGLDGIIIIKSNPVITGLTFDPSKIAGTCTPITVEATAEDADGGEPDISWSLRTAPDAARYRFDPIGNKLRFVSETQGSYEVVVTATDLEGLSNSLSFPLHIGEGSPGPCFRRPRNIDVRFVEITRRVPEFGGAYLQDGQLVVKLTDMTDEIMAAADGAVRDVLGSDRTLPADIVFEPGQFDFAFLMGTRVRARSLLSQPGLNGLGVSERDNKVKILVEDEAARRKVLTEIALLGIPADAVMVDIVPAPGFLLNTDENRPLVGGTEISPDSGGNCTLGYVGVRSGVRGFVTNSHCTNVQGGVEGTIQFQPGNGEPSVAVEMADPFYFGGGDCPGGRICRFSDSSWHSINSGETSQRGEVYKTTSSRYRVLIEYLYPLDGDFLRKVGRTTGETSGEVIDTCVDINVKDTNITLLCQDRVEAASDGGDSGSPVMMSLPSFLFPNDPNPVAAMGILWGGPDDNSYFSFSAVWNIELGQELGNMNVKFGDNNPSVNITSPTGTISFGGFNTTTLTAITDDLEDGAGCCTVDWTSNVDGNLGTGLSINYVFPTPGARTITATVTDSFGNTSSDSVTVTTSNILPIVTIGKPTSGQQLYRGLPYTLDAWAFDSEIFSNLPCNALDWQSTNLIDPFPALGCTPQSTFLVNGVRTLTVRGTDAQGGAGFDNVTFSVVDGPTSAPPIVSILQPAPNSGFNPNGNVNLVGTAQDTDNPTGNISYRWIVDISGSQVVLANQVGPSGGATQFIWTPSNDVPFNCGGQSVTIILEATDPEGTASDSVAGQVLYPPC